MYVGAACLEDQPISDRMPTIDDQGSVQPQYNVHNID